MKDATGNKRAKLGNLIKLHAVRSQIKMIGNTLKSVLLLYTTITWCTKDCVVKPNHYKLKNVTCFVITLYLHR